MYEAIFIWLLALLDICFKYKYAQLIARWNSLEMCKMNCFTRDEIGVFQTSVQRAE